ncbi:hypothetical protein ZEAMMB73_Zm00001d039421 [Zea mays]|uniref:Uncharacterized protein n=1 Tax=Zea mays TaxID=4577 RepID=A0A1D6DYF8_MAIZE|nr:hypothetical protein ZEAMMB73_Zm00001d002239 [Zea mays]ONM28724.1 hypothetical protein ZEAMMB73_Zm00001d039421 [Zea mays]
MLEAKLFLGAFSSYDRHRDMQMDIDNMSYEAQNICNLVFDKSSKIWETTTDLCHVLL